MSRRRYDIIDANYNQQDKQSQGVSFAARCAASRGLPGRATQVAHWAQKTESQRFVILQHAENPKVTPQLRHEFRTITAAHTTTRDRETPRDCGSFSSFGSSSDGESSERRSATSETNTSMTIHGNRYSLDSASDTTLAKWDTIDCATFELVQSNIFERLLAQCGPSRRHDAKPFREFSQHDLLALTESFVLCDPKINGEPIRAKTPGFKHRSWMVTVGKCIFANPSNAAAGGCVVRVTPGLDSMRPRFILEWQCDLFDCDTTRLGYLLVGHVDMTDILRNAVSEYRSAEKEGYGRSPKTQQVQSERDREVDWIKHAQYEAFLQLRRATYSKQPVESTFLESGQAAAIRDVVTAIQASLTQCFVLKKGRDLHWRVRWASTWCLRNEDFLQYWAGIFLGLTTEDIYVWQELERGSSFEVRMPQSEGSLFLVPLFEERHADFYLCLVRPVHGQTKSIAVDGQGYVDT